MASNPIPDKFDPLMTLAEDAADGCHDLEVAIGLKQNIETVIRAAIAAARNAEEQHGLAQVAKTTATSALQSADSNGRVFIGNARRRLVKFFGEHYNAQWAAAGWPNGVTSTPSQQAERMNLIASIKAHLTNTPAHASVDMDVTAAIADGLFTAISNGRNAVQQKNSDAGLKMKARDTAVRNVTKRLRGLVTELATLLEDDDPRWEAFGFSMPSSPETPNVPEVLVLTPGDPGEAYGDWADALRADRYRVWLLRVGIDADFVAVQTVFDSDALLTGLTTGQTIKVRITAVNDAGESQPSTEVEIVVP